MKKHILVTLLCFAATASGCAGYSSKTTTTGPSAAGVAALMGNWASAGASVIPSPASCTDFKWNPTEQTSNSAKGSFSASCAGDLKVSGTATGIMSGSVINWAANANASAPGLASCPILLGGTAELGVESIRIPYAGTTCLGPVSGVEVLNKQVIR
jgi:hypothetical protein